MQTSLRGIANKAAKRRGHRFGNLYEMLNEENLYWCWQFLRKKAAPGIDKVGYAEYQADLATHIHDLVDRLKRKRYRARLVRRHYIPKPNGKLRPLGIPTTEDKLLQLAVAKILEAIYEQDFLACSYGYRPGRSPRQAVKALTDDLQYGKYSWIVEADIKGFFDNIDHEWMMRMLQERLADKPFLRLIRKWLKAGILDTDGQVIHPATGTPQGGIVSPILANIYLHYALDLWFEKKIKPACQGSALLIRFADDFVCAFQYQTDAERFMEQLGARLGKFGLETAPDKTRLLRFCRFDIKGSGRFDFLGFEFRWEEGRKGGRFVKRRTSRKKLRASIANFTDWIKTARHQAVRSLFATLNSKYRGYWTYYGVIGNSASLQRFFWITQRLVFRWLNRRSQRRSYTWAAFNALVASLGVERPRITERARPLQLALL
ncbi:MAG: group II intron reverse transcriptase/maturase [Acidobacteriota bacterium]